MASTYQKFLAKGIDLTPLGIQPGAGRETYFCTPKGASIIGWTGVDGIHYCFIRGFGEMVFSVSPMNSAPNYVHPISKDFSSFLRLLLACSGEAALEQAWMWDEAQFEDFLREDPPSEERKRVQAEIADKMGLSPMEQPWQYIKQVQADFDYSRIRYPKECYDLATGPAAEPQAPEWKVYFDGSFWGHHSHDRAGEEVALDRQFEWAGQQWLIPSMYLCSKGLVFDICMRVDSASVQSFLEKWDLTIENEGLHQFTKEQRMELEMENPLDFDFTPQLELNGKELRRSRGCSVVYNSCVPEGHVYELEGKWVLEHYGLDPAYSWMICRSAFPWGTRRRPAIKTLSISMRQDLVREPGPRLRVSAPGDQFEFSDPVSGTSHTLTVREYRRETLPENSFRRSSEWEWPTHYLAMRYTIDPKLPEGVQMTVADCASGDRPIKKKVQKALADITAAAVAIIGGADGPTAIFVGNAGQSALQTTCSSLHFEPVDQVEWRIVFHRRHFQDVTVALLGDAT